MALFGSAAAGLGKAVWESCASCGVTFSKDLIVVPKVNVSRRPNAHFVEKVSFRVDETSLLQTETAQKSSSHKKVASRVDETHVFLRGLFLINW